MPRRPPAVARVLERVTETAREHEMFAPGDLVLVSCSGGPDSVCLLYSLWHLRRLFKIRLAVFHFDHKLRPDSAKDAVYVRRLADRLKLPFHLRTAHDAPGKGVSVEAWATVSRGNAANDVRREIGGTATAEGHTLDDQAETVLLNLIRGSGLEGIAGIDPGHRNHALVQPLIDVERADVEAFCRALHLRPRRDPMNDDRRYLRAAIRHEVIPVLERGTGRGVTRSIARTADLLRGDRDELFAAAVKALEGVVDGARGEDARIKVSELLALPRPVAARVIRLAAYSILSTDGASPWTKEAIGSILDLANGRPGRRRDLPNGLKAVREREYVRVSRSSPESDGLLDAEGGAMTAVSTLTDYVQAYEPDIERVLISSEEIQGKLAEMGQQISADYEGKSLLLVGVLKGAFVVMADLARYVRLPLEFDFMAVSSYGAATKTSGVVRILKDLDHDLDGMHVLLVEDIVDSGLTLKYLLKNLAARKPASLEVAALLRKTGIQKVPLDIRYVGFDIPPNFVVGYGLDFAERYRNLPYIATLKPEAYGG